VLKRKRFGNTVLIAGHEPLPLEELRRRVAGASLPTGLREGARLERMLAGAKPFGEVGEPSPSPPDPGRWRLR
jgi:hypothetical protein